MDFDLKDQIKKLVEKAAKTDDSSEALRFSQAASNVAHAMSVVNEIRTK
jgi:hypothetical protein